MPFSVGLVGTQPTNEAPTFKPFRATRISGLSSSHLNELQEQVIQNSQGLIPFFTVSLRFYICQLTQNLAAEGTANASVLTWNASTTVFADHGGWDITVRDIFGWDVSSGKKVGVLAHEQSGEAIVIAAEC